MPVAKVTVIQDGTNVSSGTVTNSRGRILVSRSGPASYTLQVEAPGFKKAELKEVVIPTQTAVARDVKLELGAVTETINVTADAEMLNTSDASTGTVLDRERLKTCQIWAESVHPCAAERGRGVDRKSEVQSNGRSERIGRDFDCRRAVADE